PPDSTHAGPLFIQFLYGYSMSFKSLFHHTSNSLMSIVQLYFQMLYPSYRVQTVLAIRFVLFYHSLDPESDQQTDRKAEHAVAESPVEPYEGIIPVARCLCEFTEDIKNAPACCKSQCVLRHRHFPGERGEEVEKNDCTGNAGRIMEQDSGNPVITPFFEEWHIIHVVKQYIRLAPSDEPEGSHDTRENDSGNDSY